MKQSRLIQFTRTGMLGLALTAFAALPGAADSVKVVNAVEEDSSESKLKAAQAAPAAPVDGPAMDGAPGEVKQQLAPAMPTLSPGLAEIIRLAQAKVGEDVLLAYIERSTVAYNPTTEEIIYLHDLGVSDKVVAEIVKRSPNPQKMAEAAKPVMTEPLNIPDVKAPVAPTAPVAPPAPGLTPLVSTNPAPAPAVAAAQPVIVQQPVIIEQPVVIQQAPEDVRYFYTSLAPYGSWVDVDGYGWCWQPTVSVTYAGWRPYHHGGRWIYSDCGWYWQSDYSWGWAPFHYGRWFNHPRRGWCWTPDRVWGPAWVSWRNSSSYCGWAPLPPAARYHSGVGFTFRNRHVGVSFEFGLGAHDYTFVSHNHFYSHNPYRHCLPTPQVTKVYNQTVVNNVIIQGNNNNVVINQGGAPVTQISKASRTEVQKVRVMDMPSSDRRSVQPDRVVRDGSSLAVFRPSGPGNVATRSGQEPAKGTVSSTRRQDGRPQINHAPADLQPQLGTVSSSTRVSGAPAPTTALQKFETPRGSLPTLTRTTGSEEKRPTETPRLGTPTHPAGTGTDRPMAAPQPVQPARPSATRGFGYTPPGFRSEPAKPMTPPQPVTAPAVTPSAPRPVTGPAVTLSQPKPVSGAPATPSPGRPVTPATPEQSRLTPQTPVSTYQAPPTAAQRFEPNRPSTTVIQKPGGYTVRPSVQPSFGGNNNNNNNSGASSLPRNELPRQRELPRNELPRYNAPRQDTYTAPSTPSFTPSSPAYTPPSQSARPERSTPSPRSYEAPRPSYTAPAQRPSYTPPPASPSPRSVAPPQSVTLPRSSAPSSPSGGGSRPSPSQGQGNGNGGENRRPGNR